MMKQRIIMIYAALAVAFSAHARHEAADTLEVAKVTAERGMVVSRTDSISLENTADVGQALMNIPGLTVTDMGGHAGLKTVSLRGMGTAHTEIFVDGIRVGNLQSGQSDLGLSGTDNFSTVTVDYIQNSINLTTARPEFRQGADGKENRMSLHAGFRTGSFGTHIPFIRLGWKLSENISTTAHAGGTFSDGDYPYHTTDKSGTAITKHRSGNDLKLLHAGIDFFGNFAKGYWQAKAYLNSSDRGTPGSIDWPSQDRQKDRNSYVQGSLRLNSGIYRLDASTKASYDEMQYMGSWGESMYEQSEIQLNTSHLFKVRDWWHMSASLGGQWDRLESGNYGPLPNGAASMSGISRMKVRSAVAGSIILNWLKADIALEYNALRDTESGNAILSQSNLSPSAGVRFRIIEDLEIAAFGRRALRTPVFNELYYIGFGNPALKPEDAWMTGIGAEWKHESGKKMTISAKADAFFNWLEDKITSSPSSHDPNIWLPYNIGKVFSAGADLSCSLRYTGKQWKTGGNVRYTFQDARDKTPGSQSFDCQIPYIARHSLVISGDGSWKCWRLDARWNCRTGRTDSSGSLEDWNTLDISLSRKFRLNRRASAPEAEISISGTNITDNSYELSRGYPMPGRSIMLGLSLDF